MESKATLVGEITSDFIFNHSVCGEKFYKFYIRSRRLSDAEDIVPVIVSERLLDDPDASMVGCVARVEGQIRTHNAHINGASHLLVYVFANEIEFSEVTYYENEVTFDGFICKRYELRDTPLGRTISDLMVAVNRKYGKSDYIPCICWGRNAQYVQRLPIGTNVEIAGRLQSRKYTKIVNGVAETRTVYEVSIARLDVKESATDEVH